MYTNNTGISLSMAVWLATDEYDHNPDPYTISVTSLMKATKQLVLSSRVPAADGIEDISSMIASRIGTAIHNSIEGSWINSRKSALIKLGYSEKIINKIRINPDVEELDDDIIPIYMEQRTSKKVGKYTISGKFDFLAEGRIEDFKSTSTFTYVNKSNDEKYIQQGSLYRWLNPTIVTEDVMAIQYIFTDWKAMMVKADTRYPATKVLEQKFKLNSIEHTEQYVKNKLKQIELATTQDESEMPECNSEELWRKDPSFKYYKNPEKTSRSTKNFNSLAEANTRLADDKFVGIVKIIPGQVVACRFCSAFPICKQKDSYIANGELTL